MKLIADLVACGARWARAWRRDARALFVAVFLLPAAAAAWVFEPIRMPAPRVAPPAARAGEMARAALAGQVQQHLLEGSPAQASRLAGQLLAALDPNDPTREALQRLTRRQPDTWDLLAAHEALDPLSAILPQRRTTLAPVLRELVARLPQAVRMLQDVPMLPVTARQLTDPEITAYARATRRGLQAPERWLLQGGPEHAAQGAEWLAVPQEQRLMIMAVGAAGPLVDEIAAAVRARGGRSFFYLDCAKWLGDLCFSEQVAAMAATAGAVLVVDPGDAGGSLFLASEMRMAGVMRSYDLLSAEDLPHGMVFRRIAPSRHPM